MADDFKDAEAIYTTYLNQYNEQIKELNKQIVGLRTKNALLQETIDEFERAPVPTLVQNEIKKMISEINTLRSDLEYYKKHVPVQIIINRQEKKKPTRSGRQLR